MVCPDGGMVDTKDLKSFGFTAVRVQVPLRVQQAEKLLKLSLLFYFFQKSGVKISKTVKISKRPTSITKLKNHFENVEIDE